MYIPGFHGQGGELGFRLLPSLAEGRPLLLRIVDGDVFQAQLFPVQESPWPCRGAAVERRTGNLPEGLLHGRIKTDKYLGRRLSGHFSNYLQGNRCRHKCGDGVHHRLRPHERGQGRGCCSAPP